MDKRPNNQKFKNFHLRRYPYCATCNLKVTKRTCVLDHIVRLHEGGPDTIHNTQLLCLACDDTKTLIENQMDYKATIEKKLQDVQNHINSLESLYEENTRKTKREPARYKRYVNELGEYESR